ncbi:MAG: efflux RND transporter periplasmic adaptor subunit [Burkholderiaceae bacterium]|nr:MAG: efflux RND transporter periplasmic adaptor subunit [Burkholderiaceae bacterium]
MTFKLNKKIFWFFGLVLAVAATLYWIRHAGAADVQYRSATIEQGNLAAVVSASGTLNPVVSVSVGSQVSGQLKEVLVDFNTPVKQGQVIARIDPETLEYKKRQAEASVYAARTAVLREQVNLTEALRDYHQRQSLFEKNFVSAADRDKAKATADAQQAVVESAKAQLAVTEAQLAQARVDLAHTVISAPVDGVVIKKNIEPGQTVAASLQAPELFFIAKDLRDMQVEASIDEADVGRVQEGQSATFTVDAFPGRSYEGRVRQVRKAALSVQNVVTYIVVIAARNEELKLLPGMTANVRITTDQRENVLKVPNAALRFRLAAKNVEAAPRMRDRAAAQSRGRLTVLENGKPREIAVQLGISDGSMTEIQGEGLVAGMTVVTGLLTPNVKGTPPPGGPRLGL